MIYLLAPVLADGPEGAEEPPTGNSIMIWVLLGILIAGMWVMQRRAKKKTVDAHAFRTELGPGQRVSTTSGMIGMISRVDGDVITIMSASGDESAWLRRAVQSTVTDEQWEALTTEYPDDPEESDDEEEPGAIDASEPDVDDPQKDS